MELEFANFLDLNALRKLQQVCFEKDAWPLLSQIAVLSLPDVIRFKVMDNDAMIGFAACDPRPSERAAWLSTISVYPDYRRRGFGRMLLRACEEEVELPSVKLCVRISNHGAIALYEKEGYRTIDVWGRYYRDSEDALVMEKVLSR